MNAKAPAKAAAKPAKAPAKKAPAKKAAAATEDAGAAVAAKREARSILRNIRISPRKLNLVAQSIRGLHVEDALAELQFSRKRIAHDVYKCLWSAQANAEENHQLDIDSLVVAQAFVGKGLVMKRMSARARGRGARIEKPFSQLTIIVREVEGVRSKREDRRGRKTKTGKGAKQSAQEAA
ncbi:MAG: 50S ribosomal protein L22 [Hyphomonadaceae bacterium]|nr:50S ribosomal protein L22 [Hyphomonadaceae bacterium]